MLELGVNIDHVATLRQARRTYEPDPVWAAVEAQLGGADLITIHLREDRRHIQDHDLQRIGPVCQVPLNLEMAAIDEMVAIACQCKPHMCTLVPEGRQEVTTEGGLDVAGQSARLSEVVARLRGAGIAVSAFIDADVRQVNAAAKAGFAMCEIHTGPYAAASYAGGAGGAHSGGSGGGGTHSGGGEQLEKVANAGRQIVQSRMHCNAGHALNYQNVRPIAALPGMRQLHIGHSIIARAVFVGLRQAVAEMKAAMRGG